MIPAIIIFLAVYILIASEKIEKTIVVIIGVFLMLALRLMPYEKALESVDLNVIFLLVGMMTCVTVLSKTGFFEWVAISIAKSAKGNPLLITFMFLIVTAVLSAFLDNVTTIILLAPITILIMSILEINPTPILILEAIASNIGGTATLIGDPPNIIIGSQAGLTFNDFLLNLSPIVIVIFIVFMATVYLLFRKEWNIGDDIKARVNEALPRLAIIDEKNMHRALWVLLFVFAGFFTQSITGLEPGVIALSGGMFMLAICRAETDSALMRIEWGLVIFFIGLFMMVSCLEYTGVISLLAEKVISLGGTNMLLLSILILAGSAIFSAFLDNIPFVITMVPLIKQLIIRLAAFQGVSGPDLIHMPQYQPLWWALALGACLGGNGSLIGASANIVMYKMSERNNYHISFAQFFKYGFPFMLQSIIVSAVFIWLKYFLN